MAAFDGSIRIDTRVDDSGFNKGIKSIGSGLSGLMSSLKGLAAAVGIAFGVAAIVRFGQASVTASTQLSNAMLGLQSILQGQGRDFQGAQDFIQQYTSDGLIPATNAITAYKNLASRGYTDPQIQTTLQALKDSAAFGRQASYSMGDAVQTATEGLKNENSILVDNAGVTKNVAQMWADYAKSIGVGANSLTKQQKIQAEYIGIMQETRFQTGDAAKLAGTYSGRVAQLGFSFNNLKIAAGNAIIPIANAALPGLNAIITALTRVANLAAQVTTALFGQASSQQTSTASTAAAAGTTQQAADAQDALATNTNKAADAAKRSQQSFDELNLVQSKDTSSADAAATSPTNALGSTAGQEMGAGVVVSPAVQAAADTIKKIVSDIYTALGPTREALSGLLVQFDRLGSYTWDALKDFYASFLVPVGKWTLGVGLPGFISALRDGMAAIDWSKINASLHGLWEALAPFAINVGEGLLWFWKNVLVPLGTWTMNNVVPAFLDILSGAIKILNGVINDMKPYNQWLWDKFLQPLASWTGGVIVGVLNGIADALNRFGDWVSKNQGPVQAMSVVIGVFMGLWKATDILEFVINAGGVIGILAKLRDGLWAVTGAKLVDQAETLYLAALYVGDFIKSVASGTAALVEQIAKWAIATGAKAADAVVSGIQAAATDIATASTWALNGALTVLTSPITLVVLAIAGIIAIVILLVTHWDTVKAKAAEVWGAVQDIFQKFNDWLGSVFTVDWSKKYGALGDLLNGFLVTVKGLWEGIKSIFSGINDFIGGVFTGNWSRAWKGVVEIFSGIWGTLATIVKAPLNAVISLVNSAITLLDNLHVKIPDGVPIFGGQTFGVNIPKIPYLAQGAVIPPNQQFMAVLGDQTNGQNLEAPEALIRQIVREESGGGNAAVLQQILAAIKAGQTIAIDGVPLARTVTKYQNQFSAQMG